MKHAITIKKGRKRVDPRQTFRLSLRARPSAALAAAPTCGPKEARAEPFKARSLAARVHPPRFGQNDALRAAFGGERRLSS
jgi:hypothetical protein